MQERWPAGYGRTLLDTVDSTNSEARRRQLAGERGPLWIASKHQASGRGRDGRRWHTEPGNLAATLLLPTPDGGAARAATLAFVAGLAVADTLRDLSGLQARLKWPNDALIDGRKVAGILIESHDESVAVGIGVNLEHAPRPEPGALETVSVREAAGAAPAFQSALTGLARRWHRWFAEWSAGFGPVRDAWLARAAFLGETVSARLPGETCRGVFEGIDADGALVLATERGRRRFASAEVFPF